MRNVGNARESEGLPKLVAPVSGMEKSQLISVWPTASAPKSVPLARGEARSGLIVIDAVREALFQFRSFVVAMIGRRMGVNIYTRCGRDESQKVAEIALYDYQARMQVKLFFGLCFGWGRKKEARCRVCYV
jgi:hypothetical protein